MTEFEFVNILIIAIPLGIVISTLSIIFTHRNDNKCKVCGIRTKNNNNKTGFIQKGYNYKCDNCDNKWRILEDY